MSKAIVMTETGGPEVLKWVDKDVPAPGPDEAQIKQTAVGLNFIDVYHRTGLYPVPGLPCTPGLEGAGVVEAVGDNVTRIKPGDRVAYEGPPIGGYAEVRNYPADRLLPIPEGVSDQDAASVMLQGLTAQYLIRRIYKVGPGDTILMHAAAGGVGLIVCQWAKALGATVIGTVGSEEKAALAKQFGCDHTILYREENFVDQVREITDGKGLPVVYDGVGQDTFLPSLDCLQPFGMMVSFGNASGPVEPFNIGLLSQKGSLFLTRPTLIQYSAKTEDLYEMADDLFAAMAKGWVKTNVRQTYPLSETAQAHRDLEARKTTGSTVLLP